MTRELEILVRQREAINRINRKESQQIGANPLVMGGQVINESEFDDENLCQLCCFQKINTKFIPCAHTTCRNCI